MIYPPRGLIADLVTPFNPDKRPDLDAFIQIMGRLVNETAGVAVGSVQAGEALDLSSAERIKLLTTALSEIRFRDSGKQIVIFFDITCRTEDAVSKLLDEAEGYLNDQPGSTDVFYLITPLIFHGNRDLPQYLKDLGTRSRRRFLAANDPDLVSRERPPLRHKNIRTAVLKKISTNEQVVGMAFNGDLDRALGYQRATKMRPSFRFYDHNETAFLERPSLSGLISIGANLAPQAWADVVDSSLNIFDSRRMYPDHFNQIWQSGRSVRALLEFYRSDPPLRIKAALSRLGILPALAAYDLISEETERLDEALGAIHLIPNS